MSDDAGLPKLSIEEIQKRVIGIFTDRAIVVDCEEVVIQENCFLLQFSFTGSKLEQNETSFSPFNQDGELPF